MLRLQDPPPVQIRGQVYKDAEWYYRMPLNMPYYDIEQWAKILNDFSFHCPIEIASKTIARQAWNIARDSYKIGVCLEYPPHTIAAGSIYLASKLMEEPLRERIYGEPWMKVLKVRSVDLEGNNLLRTL